ncbi:unnamed protein product, partial [Didymodactylos carnosus]
MLQNFVALHRGRISGHVIGYSRIN